MKRLEQLTDHVAFRSGIIVVAAIIVFALSSTSARRVGVARSRRRLSAWRRRRSPRPTAATTAILPFKVKVSDATLRNFAAGSSP